MTTAIPLATVGVTMVFKERMPRRQSLCQKCPKLRVQVYKKAPANYGGMEDGPNRFLELVPKPLFLSLPGPPTPRSCAMLLSWLTALVEVSEGGGSVVGV